MLDIHPPHHAANTWRDFFIHIITIVIGLLIALSLDPEWKRSTVATSSTSPKSTSTPNYAKTKTSSPKISAPSPLRKSSTSTTSPFSSPRAITTP